MVDGKSMSEAEPQIERLAADQVRAIARLARLACTDLEIERLRTDLAAILKYIDRLEGVDVSGVTDTMHPDRQEAQSFRNDVPGLHLPREEALAAAPRADAGAFAVQKVMETSP